MAHKRRKDIDPDASLPIFHDLGLDRNWSCVHGILMTDPCGDCATAAFTLRETHELEVKEQTDGK